MRQFGFVVSALAFGFSMTTAMAAPNVVTSIRPLHSLVASVMEGTGEPSLLIDGQASPHGYTLKPSEANTLQEADLVFWVGPELEAFLVKPLSSIAGKDASVPLIQSEGVVKLEFSDAQMEKRAARAEQADDHEHEHEHEAEEHEDHDAHDHDEDNHGEEAHAEDGEHHHRHEGTDPHIWLDPANARAMTLAIAARLEKADPENAAVYKANAEKLVARLETLTDEIASSIAPLKGKPFIVFHDAYRYFGKRFGVERAAAITINPEVAPGLAGASELHDKIVELGAVCVFSEPQFSAKLIDRLIEGTNARVATLDPLGYDIEAGPGQYEGLLRAMAKNYSECLGSI